MTEAIFFENKYKKLISFLINFVLIFGVLFIPIPGLAVLPESLAWFDIALTIIFGLPLLVQFYFIFKPTQMKWNNQKLSENITWAQHQIPTSEIIGYRFIKLLFIKYVVVDIRTPEAYIKSLPWWKSLFAKYDFKQVKSPIKIPLNRIESSVSEIYESIKKVHAL